eukprot:7377263-Prymnesium_polylepis.1
MAFESRKAYTQAVPSRWRLSGEVRKTAIKHTSLREHAGGVLSRHARTCVVIELFLQRRRDTRQLPAFGFHFVVLVRGGVNTHHRELRSEMDFFFLQLRVLGELSRWVQRVGGRGATAAPLLSRPPEANRFLPQRDSPPALPERPTNGAEAGGAPPKAP